MAKLYNATDIALTERLGSKADKIWFKVIRQTKHNSNAVYYFPDPTNVGGFFFIFFIFCFLSPSIRRSYSCTYINISTNGKQDVLKQPKANTYFDSELC